MDTKIVVNKLSIIAISILLASCGGGGGYYNNEGSSNNGSSNGGSSTSSVNISSITLNNANGQATSIISSSGATAIVKITNASGIGISGAIVNFSGENMTFSTTNGSVITNADGEASIGVLPTDSTMTGAYSLSASVTESSITATASKNISFTKTNIQINDLISASTNLESGGSTLISLITKDSDGNYQNDQVVNFTTTCGSFNNTSVVSASEGNVSTTYYAYDSAGVLCSGNQTITATPATTTVNAKTASLNITAAIATSIVYTTSSEVSLAVAGSGSSSTGQIEFTVYSNGTALPNQNVTLSLEKAPSSFSFITSGNTSNTIVKSDSEGKIRVNLYPGNIPGPVEIKASLSNGFSALSKNVTITTGRATQNSFSLSMTKNSLQNDVDGDTTTIVARLADRNGNSIPNGTVINFVTEAGKVGGSCSTTDGECSVTLRTQNPRSADGRVTVLAYVEGDKSFTDVNGDNVYTVGVDTLTHNIGSFFRDDNENNIYDIGEFKYDRVSTGTAQTCTASSFGQPNIANSCDNQLSAILRQQVLVYFASSTAVFYQPNASGSFLTFNLYGNSNLTTPMPSGTTVAVTVTDGTESNNKACVAELSSGSSPVADVVSSTYYAYKLTNCAVGDSFKISTTAPNGKVSNEYVNY